MRPVYTQIDRHRHSDRNENVISVSWLGGFADITRDSVRRPKDGRLPNPGGLK